MITKTYCGELAEIIAEELPIEKLQYEVDGVSGTIEYLGTQYTIKISPKK